MDLESNQYVQARRASIGRLIDALLLVWGASSHDEWRDSIMRLPL